VIDVKRRSVPVLGTAAMMIVGLVSALSAPAGASDWVTIMLEDFEGDWTTQWNATDHNADSSRDYWGPSSVRGVGGSESAWCAQVGTNSIDSNPNSDNEYYDQNMQAALQIVLPDMSGYSEVNLGFTYWASTGTTVLSDYLEVRAWMGTFWDHLWKQPEVDTGGFWDFVFPLEIPVHAIWLSFTFISDDEVAGGPYEGVYLDDIVIEGLDEDSPASVVSGLHDYYRNHTVYVPYTATDQGGSGIDYVELYYRLGGVAGYTMYTTTDNPEGRWTTGFIQFDCYATGGGDGAYDFYTVAVDKAGNVETPSVIPQASCIVDTMIPMTNATALQGRLTGDWQNTTVSVELIALDPGSGVATTSYRVGDGSWTEYDGPVMISAEGEFNFSYFSEDHAGNIEGIKTVALRMDFANPTGNLSGDDMTYTHDSVNLSWSSEDMMSGVDCCLLKVDDRAFEYFSSPSGNVTFSQLADGDHTATLRVFDNAGNQFEATVNFVVDTGEDETEEETTSQDYTAALAVGLILLVLIVVVIVLFARMRRVNP